MNAYAAVISNANGGRFDDYGVRMKAYRTSPQFLGRTPARRLRWRRTGAAKHVLLTALALLFWVAVGHGHTWVFSAIAIAAIWNDYRQRHEDSVPATASSPATPAPPRGRVGSMANARADASRLAPAAGARAADSSAAKLAPVRAYRRRPGPVPRPLRARPDARTRAREGDR
jgi:hypothetical protein